jgi:hypothetical protein
MLSRRSILALGAILSSCASSTGSDAADDVTVDEIAVDDTSDVSPASDRDMDGLCDDTELSLRTDPDDPDSDHDGLTDGFEADVGTSPLSAVDPPPADRMTVSEIANMTTAVSYTMGYRGSGETLIGFALDRGTWFDGRGVAELGMQLAPIAASPRGSVGDLTGPTVTSVRGIVAIQWQASITWPSIAPQGCRRAYAGYASVYAFGTGLVWIEPVYLDVHADPRASEFDAGTNPVDGGDAGPSGPWPYSTRGFCAPPPGYCR